MMLHRDESLKCEPMTLFEISMHFTVVQALPINYADRVYMQFVISLAVHGEGSTECSIVSHRVDAWLLIMSFPSCLAIASQSNLSSHVHCFLLWLVRLFYKLLRTHTRMLQSSEIANVKMITSSNTSTLRLVRRTEDDQSIEEI
jgi:hypothetical protein